ELALFLAERGRSVTVLGDGEVTAPEVGRKRKSELTEHLEQSGVRVLVKVKCDEITSTGVVVVPEGGDRQVIEADTVILAGKARPNVEAYGWLQGRVPEFHAVGDCSEVGLIKKATADAMRIACKI
ncbi:MAG: FAD-dependent oxidoreductase, partial [Chloroflexi bacterium]|nr:FAD-dependent oxidoreductase [Chloroflexota bacterium]